MNDRLLNQIIGRFRSLFSIRLSDFLKKMTDAILSCMVFLLKLIPLFVFLFILLSALKGGEPFHSIRNRSAIFLRNKVAYEGTVSSGTGAFFVFCSKGILGLSGILAENGDKILEIRKEIIQTQKEREEAGVNNAEGLKSIIQLKNDLEEKTSDITKH